MGIPVHARSFRCPDIAPKRMKQGKRKIDGVRSDRDMGLFQLNSFPPVCRVARSDIEAASKRKAPRKSTWRKVFMVKVSLT